MRIWRPRRRLRTYATAFFLGAAVLLVAGWSALPVFVERRLIEELHAAGIAVASLNVTAVGLTDTRIADLRLGPDGEVRAVEIVASYDFAHFLRAQPERLAVRDLRVSARVDSNGFVFGNLGLSNADGGGLALDSALLRAVPSVTVESGRVELATPLGPFAVPFKGTVTPRSDGSVAATIDLQAQSEHGRFAGTLVLAAAGGRIDADLKIVDGTAVLGETLSAAFSGGATATWMGKGPPQASLTLELRETSLAGTSFPAGSLALKVAEAQWTAQLELAQRNASADLRATFVVSDPYRTPRLSIAGDLTAAPGAWLWPLLGLPQPQRGNARLALRLDGPLPDGSLFDRSIATPGDAIALLAGGDVDGSLEIAIAGIVFPDLLTIDSSAARAAVHASGGTIAIEQSSALRASGSIATAQLRDLDLAPELSALLGGQFDASATLPQPLHLVVDNGTTTAVGEVGVRLASTSGASLDLQAKGRAVLSSEFAVSEFVADDWQARFDGTMLPGVKAPHLEVEGSIAGKPDQFDGRLHAAGAASGLALAGLSAASVDVDVDAAISGTRDRIAVRLVDDGAVVARGVSEAAIAGQLKEVPIPLVQAEEPLITVDRYGRVAYDLRIGAGKATVPLLLGGPKPMPVAVALPGLRWTGRWSAAGGHEGEIQLADGSLTFSSLDLRADGVRATIAITGEGTSADFAAAIGSSTKPPLFAPLSLAAKADAMDDRLLVSGVLSDRAARPRATIDVEHSFAASKGQATLKMPPLIFKPGGLQPRDLLPAISPEIVEVTGSTAIGGRIAWSGGKVASDLKLLLQDVSFKSPQADVARLNSVVNIDSLVPFTTRPGQQMAAGMVEVGLPLSDLVGTFHIEPGPRLVIENARLALAGGTMSLPTVAVDLADPRADLALNVENVDLAQLLQLAQVDGLTGTGTLTGRIPVSISGESIVIRDATLAATGPGSLRYAPATTPAALAGGGENVAMALQALSNFQYSDLTLTVSRQSGGDTVALMQVKGRNPDFYGGYPVELNLNISGKLDQILDRSLTGYRIPENIRKSLGDFGP